MNVQFIALLLISNLTFQLDHQFNKTEDPKPERDANFSDGFNKELLINIGEDTIAGYALIASEETPKETIILVPGYPGNDNNFDIAQEIRKSGKNVILFNHRGAWGSQGLYSYTNCLEDIQEIINNANQGLKIG